MSNKTYFNATRICMIALFGALSAVLYVFGFPISALFPSWLELNFSDIPALIGTFTLGPLSGSIIIVIKILIKLLVKPTSTVFVGELADLCIGLAYVITAGLLYKKFRTFRGALLALAAGSLVSIALAMLANYLVLVPAYVQMYFGGSWSPLVGMLQVIFPSATQESFYSFYIWGAVLPFNALRCVIAVAVTLPVYKHISRLIERLNRKMTPTDQQKGKKLSIGVTIAFAVVVVGIVAAVLIRYFVK